MSDEDRKSFVCEPDAIGTSLTILIRAKRMKVMLCEVQILGTGIVCHKLVDIVTNVK